MCSSAVNDMSLKIQAQLHSIVEYLKPWLPLANCHMVNFLSGNCWESFIPISIQQEAESSEPEDMYKIFSTCTKVHNDESPTKKLACNSPHFTNYFRDTWAMGLNSMGGIVLSLPELYEKLSSWGCYRHNSLKLKEFMSQKKTHEVELMSELVAALTTCCETSHVVDVGGGKGYLSSVLALHNGLQVLGLDSSTVNTHGAAKRTEKLKKVWNGLCRRADEIKKGQVPQRRGKHWKSKRVSADDKDKEHDAVQSADEYKQATVFVTPSTNIEELIQEHFRDTLCRGVTLTGLHTCGNLAPSCLQLFLTNSSIKSLTNVGCCYHLLEEKFSQNPFSSNSNVELEHGFPMSQYLINQNFSLGRNARMLAQQALHRISEKDQIPVDALFYRALLQLLLIQAYGQESPSWQVGRLANKCKDFTDYVTRAVKKLNLTIQQTSSEIADFYNSYAHRRKELEMFFMLRVTLAPVIEAVVLLDRLLYLQEQGVSESYLVQLFDPVISPRCYGLVAVKSEYLLHS